MPDSAVSDSLRLSVSSSRDEPCDPHRRHICSRCQYSGPMQVRQAYPFILRRYVIALAFCCGILPGALLLRWRRMSPPTIAVICPQCALLRLEFKSL